MNRIENTILIIEDDPNINNMLAEALKKAGYDTVQAFSGTEGRLLLERDTFPLLLLDLMLPGMSGETLLEDIRTKSDMPVIVLTAKDAVEQKVDVLRSGADDYITKPFELQEVLARIEVQLRRRGAAGDECGMHKLVFGGMELDKSLHRIMVNGQELQKLTRQEFAILELLLTSPKKVFSKEDIFEYAWEDYYMGETKTLDVHISNIRKKIRQITEDEYIETVWGIGYRMKQ